jgi:hypothetical protein
MSAHTPGPWQPHQRSGQFFVMSQHVRHPNANGLAWHDVAYLCVSNGCGEEDAKLIAAAPDLAEACATFAEWLRREEAGGTNEPWSGKRDTPEGETAWREWYDENLRICSLAQSQARAALAKAGL